MNGRSSARSLKTWAIGLGIVLVASGAGMPVGPWAMGLALVCIAVAGLATIVGMKEAAKGFGTPILVFLAIGMGAPMFAAIARSLLADPDVRTAVSVLALAAVVGGSLLLIGKAAARAPERPTPHRPSFRRRAIVVDPEPRHAGEDPRTRGGEGVATGRTETDDLDLFGGGGPRARR